MCYRHHTTIDWKFGSINFSMKTCVYLDANDDDGIPVIVFDAEIDAILCLRSGNVSMTKSRNSNKAPTSFCSSYTNEKEKKK